MAIYDFPQDSFVKRLRFSSLPHVIRGFFELRPKSMDYPKILANVARMSPLESSDPVVIFATLDELAIRMLYDHLDDKSQMVVVSPVIQSLFQVLKRTHGSISLAGISDCYPDTTKNTLEFVTSIHSNDRLLESKASEKLLLDLKQFHHARKLANESMSLVIEEKPGRFGLLNLDEPTIKTSMKRLLPLSHSSTKDLQRAPFPMEPGFAVFHASIDSLESIDPIDPTPISGPIKENYVYLAMASIQLPHGSPELDMGLLLSTIKEWLKNLGQANLGLGPTPLKHIHLAMPWLALSAYFGQLLSDELGSQTVIHFLDHGFGWHPMATLFQSWSEAHQGPILYINQCRNQSLLSLTWI